MTKDSERLKPFDNLLNICIDMSHHADTLFQFQKPVLVFAPLLSTACPAEKQ